jgi:PAS domain S-box-containing protein
VIVGYNETVRLGAPVPHTSRALRRSDRLLRYLLPAAAVGALYYVGCLAGFALRFPNSGISFFWPPTAALAAAFLVTSPRSWPSLLLATFFAHAIAHARDGVPVAAWPIQFVGNGVQAVLAAWLVRRYSSTGTMFTNVRGVLVFFFGACLVAPAVASILPSFVYVTLGWAPAFVDAWRARVISNAIASLTLIPSLVMCWRYVVGRPSVNPARVVEFALLLLALLVTNAAAATINRPDALGLSLVLYGPAPLLIWATVRFGGTGLGFALLWTTLFTIYGALQGRGPFAGGTPADTVVGVQLLLTLNAVPMLLMAALLEQNRASHRELLDVERQNSAILRALPDVMLLQNRDGICLRCYPPSADALPWLASAPGRPMRDVLPPAMADAFLEAASAVQRDEPSVVEFTCVIGDVAKRLEGRFIGVDDDRVLAVIRDITTRWQSDKALREAEQRYALATSAGGIGIWELYVPTAKVVVQGSVEVAIGYTAAELDTDLGGLMNLIVDSDREDVQTRLRAFIEGTADSYEAEFRVRHKDGSLRWLAARGRVAETRDGKALRIIGTFTNVTERKQSALALTEANDALVRTGRIAAMAAFSASIAHELSQPLTGIATNTSACLRWIDSTAPLPRLQLHNALDDVLNDCRRAAHIIERTNALFSNRPARKRQVDLNQVVREILDAVHVRVRESGVRVKVRTDRDLPAVLSDPVQMQQVVLNLIINAIDAMRDGVNHRRLLELRTRYGRRFAFVSVRDTGAGLQTDDVHRLFDPFFTTKPDGTGMGLTISRSIVASHGGSLWAVSNIDRGMTFRFKVPLADRGQTR